MNKMKLQAENIMFNILNISCSTCAPLTPCIPGIPVSPCRMNEKKTAFIIIFFSFFNSLIKWFESNFKLDESVEQKYNKYITFLKAEHCHIPVSQTVLY